MRRTNSFTVQRNKISSQDIFRILKNVPGKKARTFSWSTNNAECFMRPLLRTLMGCWRASPASKYYWIMFQLTTLWQAPGLTILTCLVLSRACAFNDTQKVKPPHDNEPASGDITSVLVNSPRKPQFWGTEKKLKQLDTVLDRRPYGTADANIDVHPQYWHVRPT